MKICYLCADRGIALAKINGASAHFRTLVRTFGELGHAVVVVSPNAQDAHELGVEVVPIPTSRTLATLLTEAEAAVRRDQRAQQRARKRVVHALGHIWNNVAVEAVLTAELTRMRPDLLFEVYSPFGVAGGVVARALGIRHILNVHAPLAWEGATYRSQALQDAAELLEDTAFRAAQHIVCNSREMHNLLLAAGVPSEKVTTVPNGVDTALFSPHGATANGLPAETFVTGFVGSLKAWHGIDVLLDAFREVAVDPRHHLLVVGDGPLAKDVQHLADELPGRVTLTGAVHPREVPRYVRAMHVGVAPYPRLERFYFSPLKVLEYMAVGRPVVASAIGQIPELVRDGDTGLLVEPGDPHAIAAALRRLAVNPAWREQLGARGAAVARAEHAWTRRAAEILCAGRGVNP